MADLKITQTRSAIGTSNRLRLASSVPFWMASGTSLALP